MRGNQVANRVHSYSLRQEEDLMKTELSNWTMKYRTWSVIARWGVAVVGVGVGLLSVPITPVWRALDAQTGSALSTSQKDLPTAVPEEVGMSTERLTRIADAVNRAIEVEAITGAVTLVVRKGKVAHFEAHGMMDLDSMRKMETDTIFQIASMTKPIAGVAFLMLLEEGKVRLADPVKRFIPEFEGSQVAVARSDSDDDAEIYLVPAYRDVTVRDLLTHTSGLVSGGVGTREASRIAPRHSDDTLETYAADLGGAPLDFQPGTQWSYSGLAGIDTVARIVEVVAGVPFDDFLRERLFEPLGMHDTGYIVPPEKLSRVVTRYVRTDSGLEERDKPSWVDTVTLTAGGVGLWSTAGDYAKFAQMLVNEGELKGHRFLGRKTVELMAANHVSDLYEDSGRVGGRPGRGFGLTVDVVLDSVVAQDNRSTGSFGWLGALGTAFWVDPEEAMTAVLMVQTPGGTLRADFQNAVRQAIID